MDNSRSSRVSSAPSSAIVGRWMHRNCPGAAKEELSTPLPSQSIRFLTSLTKVHGCKPLAHLRLHPLDHLSSPSPLSRLARLPRRMCVVSSSTRVAVSPRQCCVVGVADRGDRRADRRRMLKQNTLCHAEVSARPPFLACLLLLISQVALRTCHFELCVRPSNPLPTASTLCVTIPCPAECAKRLNKTDQ